MKIKEWDENYLAFDNGSTIKGKHKQDCCEYNFANFDAPLIKGRDDTYRFNYYTLEKAEKGFILILHGCPHHLLGTYDQRIYIPCYSFQSGNDSDEITICFYGAGEHHTQHGEWDLSAALVEE